MGAHWLHHTFVFLSDVRKHFFIPRSDVQFSISSDGNFKHREVSDKPECL